MEEVRKRSKNLQSKYEYCKTLTFLSECLKKQTLQSSEDELRKALVLEHFKVTPLTIRNSSYDDVMNCYHLHFYVSVPVLGREVGGGPKSVVGDMRDQRQSPCDLRRVRPGGRGHHQLQGVARGGAHDAVEQRRASGCVGRRMGKERCKNLLFTCQKGYEVPI